MAKAGVAAVHCLEALFFFFFCSRVTHLRKPHRERLYKNEKGRKEEKKKKEKEEDSFDKSREQVSGKAETEQ